ncbi:MAG TPA: PBP1A family penicillin-binding protein [Vicinamibacterales bacterium]|nr:PBP1A family penicillin-binding protein [Vicinamibacterales bacterium]
MPGLPKLAKHAGLAFLFVAAALAGTGSGVLFAYSDDLPAISALDTYQPDTITRVLASDGTVAGEFAVERRVVLRYDEIPLMMRQAVLAAEDSGFFEHFGLSVTGLARAAVTNLVQMRKAGGASTLTQQLARKLFLTDEKTWERKVKELLLAIQIEKRYTKEEIFTLYCNQMYFGHGAYGVEAAARLYFDKPVKDLVVEEAAMIAGILQANVRQSPFVNLSAARRRRNYTLDRMAAEGFIAKAEAEAAKERPIVTHGVPSRDTSFAPYYLEEVRKHLEAKYGAQQLYESGLSVRTPLDVRLQGIAAKALDAGLRRVDKRRTGFRKAQPNVLHDGVTLASYRHERWQRPLAPGDIVPALVSRVDAAGQAPGHATVRIGAIAAELTRESFRWTRKTHASQVVREGDLVDVELLAVDEAAGTAEVKLEQTPLVEGAVVALDNSSGNVLAMVGGFSFSRSKFNRATQALRQVGSTFKPILYTAAIDRGLTPATVLVDEPTEFEAGAGQPPYQPRNYDGKFEGPITLRTALERSRNIPAVKVMEMLGPPQVVPYAERFGLPGSLPPFLSSALGAGESTLIALTSAYSAFPNHGVRMAPVTVLSVTDREGVVLEEPAPDAHDALRADTAYVMTSLLRGVVQRGTAASALSLNWPLAGKTGTVNDYTDAWFVGFDPEITLGVWLGYDEKKPIGNGETGTTAALPVWIDIMRAYLEGRDRENPPQFEAPGNIVFVPVDRHTGQPVEAGTPQAITEAFITGTQPSQ